MLDECGNKLNKLISGIYTAVQRVEQDMIKNTKLELSISELNVIESVAKHGKGCSVGDIAQDLHLSAPSVTVCVQRLESKGYMTKVRSLEDGRKLNIVLTRTGKKADAVHRYFHEQAVRAMLKDTTQEEQEVLLEAITNLHNFLQIHGEAKNI